MPERQDLDAFPGNCYSIVDVVVDALEVNSSNAGQGRVGGTGADFGLAEMSIEARSNSSRIALGALSRLNRHQLSACRTC